jgi:hypothetical protein
MTEKEKERGEKRKIPIYVQYHQVHSFAFPDYPPLPLVDEMALVHLMIAIISERKRTRKPHGMGERRCRGRCEEEDRCTYIPKYITDTKFHFP